MPTFEKEIKAIQRKQERSRRKNNPNNFDPDDIVTKGKKSGRKVKRKGKVKKSEKGKRLECKNSKRYQELGKKRRELERRKTAYAQSQNRKLVNEILRKGGKHISMENVSVKGWQKLYGKAISAKSPGFFQSELCRKAESANGVVHKYLTQKTACSQTHLDGLRVKKSLSERVHKDNTGVVMHRDIFSAYLGLHVNQEGELSVEDARVGYLGSEPILKAAWTEYESQQRLSVATRRKSGSKPRSS